MYLRFPSCLMVAFSICVLLYCNPSAKADTYTYRYVGYGNATTVASVDDYGDYIIGHPYGAASCPTTYNGCYETYYAATGMETWTDFMPSLLIDPSPIAGTGCTYTGSFALTQICVNGHQVVSGVTGLHNVSSVTPFGLVDFYAGTMDSRVMSANGNLLFVDGSKGEIVLALNQSALPTAAPVVTPEPSSFALLGTGLLGMVGTVRRRWYLRQRYQ